MESLILKGSDAVSGVLTGTMLIGSHQGYKVMDIQFDIPPSEESSSTMSLTLSGSVSGPYVFNNDISPELRFYKGENITYTTANQSGNYDAVIKYIIWGDMIGHMWADTSRGVGGHGLIPSWTRRTPRSS